MVTTSYVTQAMMELDAAAKEAGIVVMNEIGLDPGIGMSTKNLYENDVKDLLNPYRSFIRGIHDHRRS